MQHLDTDRLAALADEAATNDESLHLATCLACRRERDAFVALLALAQREGRAAFLPDASAAPLTSWESLSGALRAGGLARAAVASPAPARDVAARSVGRLGSAAFVRRAAASLALIVGGGAIGRLTAPPTAAADGPFVAASQVAASAPGAQLASVPAGDVSDGFGGVSDAMQTLARAQRDYQRAAAYLAEHDASAVGGTPQILRARLAALDEVMPKVREALYEAPQDPVLNQYYLATADVRESTLRQLGRALPTGVRLTGY